LNRGDPQRRKGKRKKKNGWKRKREKAKPLSVRATLLPRAGPEGEKEKGKKPAKKKKRKGEHEYGNEPGAGVLALMADWGTENRRKKGIRQREGRTSLPHHFISPVNRPTGHRGKEGKKGNFKKGKKRERKKKKQETASSCLGDSRFFGKTEMSRPRKEEKTPGGKKRGGKARNSLRPTSGHVLNILVFR